MLEGALHHHHQKHQTSLKYPSVLRLVSMTRNVCKCVQILYRFVLMYRQNLFGPFAMRLQIQLRCILFLLIMLETQCSHFEMCVQTGLENR